MDSLYESMWPIARFIYESSGSPSRGANILYIVIFLLCIIVFKLGFAQKLPLVKNIVIYVFLALGCTVLTLLGALLPIAEALVIAVLILAIYKIRLHQSKKNRVEV